MSVFHINGTIYDNFYPLNKLNYHRNNPILYNSSADDTIRKSMDPPRVSWKSISKFIDKF